MDERADPAQRAALTRVCAASWWPVGTLHQDLPAGRSHPGALRRPARRSTRPSTRIGEAVQLELQKIRNPVTQAEVHPEVVLPEGLVVKKGSMAASSVFRVGDALGFDHSGQYAAFGKFDYA